MTTEDKRIASYSTNTIYRSELSAYHEAYVTIEGFDYSIPIRAATEVEAVKYARLIADSISMADKAAMLHEHLMAIAKQAKLVRELQVAYFKDRTKEHLIASKDAERALDKMLVLGFI